MGVTLSYYYGLLIASEQKLFILSIIIVTKLSEVSSYLFEQVVFDRVRVVYNLLSQRAVIQLQ